MMNHNNNHHNNLNDDEDMESLPLDDGHSYSGDASPPPPTPPPQRSTFIDPPSYAEATFTSFDSTTSTSSSNGHDSSPSSSSDSSDFLIITVSEPKREPNQTFFTYLITTRTNLREFGSDSGSGSEFEVRRRFRDVVALSDRLGELYRGYFVPVRPDKNVVESQVRLNEEFVEARRVELEKYLRSLAKHPLIRKSEEFRGFLCDKGSFGVVKSADDGGGLNEEGKKGGRDFLWMFKELKQSVAVDWGGAKPVFAEEDKEFLEWKERLTEFEREISNFSVQAESLVKAQQDIGETMGELGLAFDKLTKLETDEAVVDPQRERATDLKTFGSSAVKASRLYRELNSQTIRHMAKLHEYLGVMLSVNNAFSERSSALLKVQTYSAELKSLQSKIEKLEAASSKIFGGDRSKLQEIEKLKESVTRTENDKSSALTEYEKVKENNKSELERLDKQKHDDLLSMLKGFVVNQAGYAEKMSNVWEKVAEETSRYAKGSS